jgi:hypothetical protein
MNKQEKQSYLIELRRSKVQSLLSSGMPQNQIAQALSVSTFTVSQDVSYLRQQARLYIQNFESHFAEEYTRILDFLLQVQQHAWSLSLKFLRDFRDYLVDKKNKPKKPFDGNGGFKVFSTKWN